MWWSRTNENGPSGRKNESDRDYRRTRSRSRSSSSSSSGGLVGTEYMPEVSAVGRRRSEADVGRVGSDDRALVEETDGMRRRDVWRNGAVKL